MELLAPAGSFEALRAAVENGADAVYLGGKSYGARASAVNFSSDELRRAFDYCHIRGVKVYVTVNTLLKDSEIGLALEYLSDLYAWGADAVIVQDLGLAFRAAQELPKLELHGSTQMTLHNYLDLNVLEKLGFKRVVLARELSLQAISEIKKSNSLELEVFIHGALCICYSGQCLMSSFIGGRSGNRGQCAQPCRLPYQVADVDVPGEYIISPKDLALIDHLAALRQSGVCSLKIEGRLKNPDYVGVVVRTYRQALDGLAYEREDLETVFNRGFSSAYIDAPKQPELITYNPPLKEERTGSAVETYTSDKAFRKIKASLWVTLKLGGSLELNLLDEDGVQVEVKSEILSDKARGTGLTKELIEEKLLRLGNDPLEIENLDIALEEGLHLPISELNNMRRTMVQIWQQKRLDVYQRPKLEVRLAKISPSPKELVDGGQKIAVTVSNLATTKAALEAGAQLVYFSGEVYRRQPQDWFQDLSTAWALGQEYGALVFAHLERITENPVLAEIRKYLPQHRFDGILVGNMGTWELVNEFAEGRPVHTDWSFNVFNSHTLEFLAQQGAKLITLSLELQLSQILELVKTAKVPVSTLVQGPLESMVTKHCIFRDQGCKFQCTQKAPLEFKDKKGYSFPVYFDRWCQMHIYNSRELSLVDHLSQLQNSKIHYLRIEGRLKEADWVRSHVEFYGKGLAGEKLQIPAGEFTKGHYFRGVL